MGTKITRYPNMKILPNDGVKFKCKCGCELNKEYFDKAMDRLIKIGAINQN